MLVRRAIQLGLTVNALRPARGRLSVPAFFAGWLTAELAPQLLAGQAIDLAARLAWHGVRTRNDRIGLAMGVLSLAGLGALIASGPGARRGVGHAPTGAPGGH